MTKNARLPARSARLGTGKEIGGAVYVHRRYEGVLGAIVAKAKNRIPKDFEYHVVKYNYRTETVSFIQCFDFDDAPEPTVGDILYVDRFGVLRRRQQPADPEIYHHKWLLVSDDYEGFDVDESRQRSLRWLQLQDVELSRIGRKSYWERCVLPRLTNLGDE